MIKLKSIYPEGWKEKIEKNKSRKENPNDKYAQIAKNKSDIDFTYKPGHIRIAWTIMPEFVDQPRKIATLGEMIEFWDHINEDLYKRIIYIKYKIQNPIN